MMQPTIPYLVFPGKCREAMAFYSELFSGKITTMQTFGESPMEAPADCSDLIFNSELKAGDLVIKASDNLPSYQTHAGNNVSLYITFPSQQSQQSCFDKLAEEGKVLFPISSGFGMIRDKYEVQWMLVFKG